MNESYRRFYPIHSQLTASTAARTVLTISLIAGLSALYLLDWRLAAIMALLLASNLRRLKRWYAARLYPADQLTIYNDSELDVHLTTTGWHKATLRVLDHGLFFYRLVCQMHEGQRPRCVLFIFPDAVDQDREKLLIWLNHLALKNKPIR